MISVAVCTYNGEKYIGEQLQSIIKQTRQPDEIIVCDDCSKDKTVDIVKDILKEWNGQYKIVINKINLGFKKNFEKAIGLCQGDIIFLSDQDDVWDLNKIQIVEKYFQDDDAFLVFHDANVVDENLKLLYNSFWNLLNFNYKKLERGNYKRLLQSNVVQGCACAFRNELFYYAKPFPDFAFHDEWLTLVAVLYGKIVPVPEKLLMYRQSSNNIVGAKVESVASKIKKWILNIRKSPINYFVEINRRDMLFDEYVKRFGLMTDISIYAYSKFLKRRKIFLKENKWTVLMNMHYYINGYGSAITGIKIWLKDFFVLWTIKR